MKIFRLLVCLFVFSFYQSSSQKPLQVQIVTSGTNTSLRGMSIPSDKAIWVSGSNGTIGKSVDRGKTWRWIIVSGFEKRDFRDIEAFDSTTAIAMAVDNPAIIVKTTDGGASWKKVFERTAEGMFLDAMDFKNSKEGICIGDPLFNKQTNTKQFYIIRTFDGGEKWTEIAAEQMPAAQPGEAIFAASGTNILFLNNPDFEYGFVTGGAVSNLYMMAKPGKTNQIFHIPMQQAKETAGTFSMAVGGEQNIYCAGGDFKAPQSDTGNYQYSTNAGRTWHAAAKPPSGYKSCIQVTQNKMLAACGTSGVDVALSGHQHWKKISAEGFNVCKVSGGKQIFFAGEKGKIGKLVL